MIDITRVDANTRALSSEKQLERMTTAIRNEHQVQVSKPTAKLDVKKLPSKQDLPNRDAIPMPELPVKVRYQPQRHRKHLDRFLASRAAEAALSATKQAQTKNLVKKASLKTCPKKNPSLASRVLPDQATEWDLVPERNNSPPSRLSVEKTKTTNKQVLQVLSQSRAWPARLSEEAAGGSRNAKLNTAKERTPRRLPADELQLVAARSTESDSNSEPANGDDESPLELPEDQISQELSSEEPQTRSREVKRIPKCRLKSRSTAIDITEFRIPKTPCLPARDGFFSCSDGFEGKEAEPIGKTLRVRLPSQRSESVRVITKGIGELTIVAEKFREETHKNVKTIRFDYDHKRHKTRRTLDKPSKEHDPMPTHDEEPTEILMLLDAGHGWSPRGQLVEAHELSYMRSHMDLDEDGAQHAPYQKQNQTGSELQGQLPTPLTNQRKRPFSEISVDVTPTCISEDTAPLVLEETLEVQSITMDEGQLTNPAHIDIDENSYADNVPEGSISIMGSDEGLDSGRSTQSSDEDSSSSEESSSKESDGGDENSDEDEVEFTSNPVQACTLPLQASHGNNSIAIERPPSALREEAESPIKERERSPNILYVEEDITDDTGSDTESVSSSSSKRHQELHHLCSMPAAVGDFESIGNVPKIKSQTASGSDGDTGIDGQTLIQTSKEKYVAIEQAGLVKSLSGTPKLIHSEEHTDNENRYVGEEYIQTLDPVTPTRKHRPAITFAPKEVGISPSPYRTTRSGSIDDFTVTSLRQSASQALQEVGSVFDNPQGVADCDQSWRPKLPISSGDAMVVCDEITDPPSSTTRRRASSSQRQLSQQRLARSQSLIIYQSRLSPVLDDVLMDRQDTQSSPNLNDGSIATYLQTSKHSQLERSIGSDLRILEGEIPETQFEENLLEPHESQLTPIPDMSYFQRASQDLSIPIPRFEPTRAKSMPAYITCTLPSYLSKTDSCTLGDPYSSQLSLSASRASSRLPIVIEENSYELKSLKALIRQASIQLSTLPNCGRKRTISLPFKPPFKKMKGDR